MIHAKFGLFSTRCPHCRSIDFRSGNTLNAVTHELKTRPIHTAVSRNLANPRRRTFVETRRTYILRGSNRWDRVTLKEMVSHP